MQVSFRVLLQFQSVVVFWGDVKSSERLRKLHRSAPELPVGRPEYELTRPECDLYVIYRFRKWSGRPDSNRRPPAPKTAFNRQLDAYVDPLTGDSVGNAVVTRSGCRVAFGERA